MSENLLNRVTPWPWKKKSEKWWKQHPMLKETAFAIEGDESRNGLDGGWDIAYFSEGEEATPRDALDEKVRQFQDANADLFLHAPDHALLLAAITCGSAEYDAWTSSGKGGTVAIRVDVCMDPVTDKWEVFDLAVDPFYCPILTPELRAALKAALGIKP